MNVFAYFLVSLVYQDSILSSSFRTYLLHETHAYTHIYINNFENCWCWANKHGMHSYWTHGMILIGKKTSFLVDKEDTSHNKQ